MKVHKAFAEAQWPTVAFKFPGVEIAFGEEDENGDAELLVAEGHALPETLAHAMGVSQTAVTRIKPGRPAVWEDFIDHGQEQKMNNIAPPMDSVGAGEGGEVVEAEEAPKPKRKAPAKKAAAKKAPAKKKE